MNIRVVETTDNQHLGSTLLLVSVPVTYELNGTSIRLEKVKFNGDDVTLWSDNYILKGKVV
jgi:hypothetical protein